MRNISYYLSSNTFLKEKNELCTGSTQSALNDSNAKKLFVPLPPLNEQAKIVEKIDTLFKNLDESIEKFKEAKLKLKQYRKLVLSFAFEGKLTEEWREINNYDSLTVKKILKDIKSIREKNHQKRLIKWERDIIFWIESKKKGKKPLKPISHKDISLLKDDNLFKLPSQWIWTSINHIILESVLGKMLDRQKNIGKLYPYLGNINVRWGFFDLTNLSKMKFEEHEKNRYELEKGDLIICEGGEAGRCAIWELENSNIRFQKALHRVRVSSKIINNKYLYYFMLFASKIGFLEKYLTGTTIKHLTGKGLSQVSVPLCSTEEQNQIVQEIEIRLSTAEKMEESIDINLAKAEKMYQSILTKAFRGELVDFIEIKEEFTTEELLTKIQLEKTKYEKEQKKKKRKTRSKKVTKKLSLVETLSEAKNHILKSEELWRKSIYFNDIESFYSKLKEEIEVNKTIVESKNSDNNESYLRLANAN